MDSCTEYFIYTNISTVTKIIIIITTQLFTNDFNQEAKKPRYSITNPQKSILVDTITISGRIAQLFFLSIWSFDAQDRFTKKTSNKYHLSELVGTLVPVYKCTCILMQQFNCWAVGFTSYQSFNKTSTAHFLEFETNSQKHFQFQN